MAFDPFTAIFELGGSLINKLFPDKEQQAKARLQLLELTQTGELKQLEAQLSVMLAEAKSKDKWTSRARPSFLYVIYIMILASIPMGVLTAIDPIIAKAIATGMKEWLAAIPNSLWGLFGVGYVGYVGARSYDKNKLEKTGIRTLGRAHYSPHDS